MVSNEALSNQFFPLALPHQEFQALAVNLEREEDGGR